ncbi:MAG: exosortase U [Planctomycetaceae bacterium]
MTNAVADVGDKRPWARLRSLRGWLLVVIVCAHLPLLTDHFLNLWHRPHYRFLPILLGVCAYLLWQRWPRKADAPYVAAPILASMLLMMSVTLLGTGVWLNSPMLGAASAIFATGFLIVSLAGVRAVQSCIGVWALMWVMIPPPLGYDLALISQLQSWTSAHASDVLDLLGIDHLMAGNVLTLPDTTFFVDEACSGVHSLFALFGYTAVFVVFTSRGLRRGLLLLASTIPWALFLNLLRIVTIAVVYTHAQIDLSSGWSHEVLGFFTFVIALFLTLSTDQLLGAIGYWCWTCWMALRSWLIPRERRYRWYAYRSVSEDDNVPSQEVIRRPLLPAGIMSLLALCLYGAIGVTQVTGATSKESRVPSWSGLANVTEETLPKALSGFGRGKFEAIERDWSSDLGRSSRIWNYETSEFSSVVSADFPFFGWHELTRCYEGVGWQLQQRSVQSQPQDGWHVVEATFTNESGEHAYLVYGMLNHHGMMLAPPTQVDVKRFVDRVRQQSCVQVQAFSPSNKPLPEERRQQVQELFRSTVLQLKPILSKASGE